ncbi:MULTISPECIES: universal stress protein [unclassified Bradyrhizobium]|uniref:universal stress protein n=1 Tax=unclassified Bradyrhizobium TaxID=2631580 RepID=UPI0024784C9D|nr:MULTISPECIES: universal stress protein [unclassified Bradyrhizobium]
MCRRLEVQAPRAVPSRPRELHAHVVAGHPVRDIVDFATKIRAELLVIGATGHSALYERLIGSRADRIVQLARCPVLVVK